MDYSYVSNHILVSQITKQTFFLWYLINISCKVFKEMSFWHDNGNVLWPLHFNVEDFNDKHFRRILIWGNNYIRFHGFLFMYIEIQPLWYHFVHVTFEHSCFYGCLFYNVKPKYLQWIILVLFWQPWLWNAHYISDDNLASFLRSCKLQFNALFLTNWRSSKSRIVVPEVVKGGGLFS